MFERKAVNVLAVLAFNLLWTILLLVLFSFLFSGGNDIQNNLNWKLVYSSSNDPGIWYLILLACVFAPFLEELIFRKIPLDFISALEIRTAGKVAIKPGWEKRAIIYISLFSSVVFGMLHGPLGVFFQGMIGLSFCWLYIRNDRCYWSVVVSHAIWNGLVIWGIPFLVKL